MFLVICPHCHTIVRILGDADQVATLIGVESDFWPNKYICVGCGKSCQGLPELQSDENTFDRMRLRELTVEEMFAAQNGLGTPDEMVCDLTAVRELLPGIKVHGQTLPGTTHCAVTVLELANGVRLHLGASAHGAIVYRITRPISYTQKVLETES